MDEKGDNSRKGMSAGKAFIWQLLSKISSACMQFIIAMILARLLTPEDYGMVAIVAIFIAFFAMLSDVGIAPAVVQYQDLSKRDIGALFVFSAILGFLLCALFCLASYPISIIYGDPQLIPLCIVASISVIFTSANAVPNGILLKEKRFKLIAIRQVLTSIVSGIIAIVLAMLEMGCYALVLQTVLQSLFVFVWNILGSKVSSPNINFVSPVRKVFRYSAFQALFSFVNYFSGNLDNMLVGWRFDAAQLGYYDKAYKLNGYPINFLSSTVSSVLQPYLVKHKDDPHAMYQRYIAVVKPLSLSGTCISLIFITCAPEIIEILFGSQWEQSAILLRMLSVALPFMMINSVAGVVLQSAGHTDFMFYTCVINTTLTIIGILYGIWFGSVVQLAIGVAVAKSLHTVTNSIFLTRSVFRENILSFSKLFLPELLMILFSAILAFVPFSYQTSLLMLIPKITFILIGCFIVYATTNQLDYIKGAFAMIVRHE